MNANRTHAKREGEKLTQIETTRTTLIKIRLNYSQLDIKGCAYKNDYEGRTPFLQMPNAFRGCTASVSDY